MLSKYFCYYLPLALHLNTLEFLSLKNALCWVWLKLAKWLRWRKLLNALYIFSIFCYYLHWKRAWPLNSFEETLILSIQGCLYLVWWKLVQWFSKWISMKIKLWTVCRQTMLMTDSRGSKKSLELSLQVS